MSDLKDVARQALRDAAKRVDANGGAPYGSLGDYSADAVAVAVLREVQYAIYLNPNAASYILSNMLASLEGERTPQQQEQASRPGENAPISRSGQPQPSSREAGRLRAQSQNALKPSFSDRLLAEAQFEEERARALLADLSAPSDDEQVK